MNIYKYGNKAWMKNTQEEYPTTEIWWKEKDTRRLPYVYYMTPFIVLITYAIDVG